MPKGYTLTEMSLALAIAGILAGVAVPPTLRMRDALAVEQAAQQIAGAHRRARMLAVLRNHTIVLSINDHNITLRLRHDTTTLWREAGPAVAGVTLAAPARQVTFSPIGLAMGASNATYTITRGDARRRVIVSRLGRVRITS